MKRDLTFPGLVLISELLMLAGCASSSQNAGGPVLPPAGTVGRGATVNIGLNHVDPARYGGWDGQLSGCVLDANGLASIGRAYKLPTSVWVNSWATWPAVQTAIRWAATEALRSGGVLVITESSHGGQLPDDNGDEADGQDETVCLYDGQVRDDAVLRLIASLPPVRIVLISDQCHAEGNFRAAARAVQRAVGFGKRRGVPVADADALKGWGGALIQMAGCREAEYSGDTRKGGVWSVALQSTFRDGIDWREWFDAAARQAGDQVPVWVEYGKVTDGFRNSEAFR